MNVGHSLYSIGLVGMQNGLKQMQQAADNVAKATNPNQDVDLNEAAVNLLQSKLQFEAAVMVLKKSNDMLGSLIDTEA